MALGENRKATIRCLIRGGNGLGEWHTVKDNQPFLVREKPTAKDLTMPDGYLIDSRRSQIVKTPKGFERVLVFNEGNPIALDSDVPLVGLDAIKVGLLIGPLVARIKLMGLSARDQKAALPMDWKIMVLLGLVVIALGGILGHYLWPTPAPAPGHVVPAGG